MSYDTKYHVKRSTCIKLVSYAQNNDTTMANWSSNVNVGVDLTIHDISSNLYGYNVYTIVSGL